MCFPMYFRPFQPTPPARTETAADVGKLAFRGDFNPLRPRGRRRMRGSRDDHPGKISTHSAREDGDALYLTLSAVQSISTHSAREDGDWTTGSLLPTLIISTHSAREDGDGTKSLLIVVQHKFQPTPPARTETEGPLNMYRVPINFNPLRPRGRRLDYGVTITNTNYFNPLRPRGRRRCKR